MAAAWPRRWNCSARGPRRQVHDLASRRRHRPRTAERQARRDPRLRQPGPGAGAQPARQRDRRRRRPSRRIRKHDRSRGGGTEDGAGRRRRRIGRRGDDAGARRNPRRALSRDRAASAARSGARLQPWPVDPLRLHRAARGPRRVPGRSQRAGHGAPLAVSRRQGHDRPVGGCTGCDRQCTRASPSLMAARSAADGPD